VWDIEQIAKAHAVQAIPILEAQFGRSRDPGEKASSASGSVGLWDLDKAHIASALVRLGDKDAAYWTFLIKQATLAVESDAPSQVKVDPQGRVLREPSPEFISWAKAHGMTSDSALEVAMYRFPGYVKFLAETADPRAIPLLRQALSSPNFMIQTYAAEGLAQLQDKDSILLIIEACQKAPVEAASAIARFSLPYFDDPRAQAAAETYLPKETVKAIREEKHLPGSGPFN
jgi:hypothetical protein